MSRGQSDSRQANILTFLLIFVFLFCTFDRPQPYFQDFCDPYWDRWEPGSGIATLLAVS